MASYLKPLKGDDFMKKTIIKSFAVFSLSILFTFLLIGCNGNSGENTQSTTNEYSEPKTPPIDAIKIDQVPYSIANVVDGRLRRVGLTYTNSSEYCIVSYDLSYKMDSEATYEEVAPAYQSAEEQDPWLTKYFEEKGEDQLNTITGYARINTATYPGETSEADFAGVLGRYMTNTAQFDYLRPDLLKIKYLNNNRIYTETYDYTTSSYSLSNDIDEIPEWPDNEFTETLPSPDSLILGSVETAENNFSFETIGTSLEVYKKYISECKEAGFSKKVDESEYSASFEATSNNGKYTVEISLNETSGEMDVKVTAINNKSNK